MKKPSSRRENIEDFYALSPMQEGMLFHTLYAPDSGVYYEQIRYRIGTPLFAEHMQAAWQEAVNRHSALRTVFAWRNVESPLQVVARNLKVDWSVEETRAAQLEDILKTDIIRGFDLARAPLFRVRLYQVTDRKHQELVVAFHHILLDMWSYSLIEKEVFADYRARLRGERINFPLPRPYKDFIQHIKGRTEKPMREFWRAELRDFRGGVAPAGTPDNESAHASANPLSDFGEVEIRLASSRTKALRDFAREHHLTLNSLLSGAWALLLRRHTRETDVLFGMTVSGRPTTLEGFESMTGLFINTLPVRVEIRDDESAADFLKRLQRKQATLRNYEDTPLRRVAEWCGLSDTQRSLFDSILVVENIPDSDRTNAPAEPDIESVAAFEKTNYPLTVVFHPGAEVRALIKFNKSHYSEFDGRSLLEQLVLIVESFARNPQGLLRDVQILDLQLHNAILAKRHEPAPKVFSTRLIHEQFQKVCRRFPGHTALSFRGETRTYQEVEQQANLLAEQLIQAGVPPEEPVGLYLPRSSELIIAMLAVLKAGACYLPLDPDYPAERIEYIIQDAKPSVLVTNTQNETQIPATNSDIRIVDIAEVLQRPGPQAPPFVPVHEKNLAYIIYTSGSTGQPKGVMVEHGHVVDLFTSSQAWAKFNEHDVWTMYHSASFDFSVWEIWGALLFGGRLEIVDYWTSRSPGETSALLQRESVTVFNQTPSAFRRFMEHPANYPHLRLIIFGGEALDPRTLKPWFERHQESPELINMFGITETIVHVTHRAIRPEDTDKSNSIIGRPLAGKRVYILDEFLNPQPVGVAGEIFVGGRGIARGYLNRPELTIERFVPCPFNTNEEQDVTSFRESRMYRSGDLGRALPDGSIEYLGRVDDQLKIRGFRIEPGEIEAALCAHESVTAAVVTARGSGDDKHLVGYYVSSREIPIDELRSFLMLRLPEHMLPARYMHMDTLPLTRNAKVDRKALPEPSGLTTKRDSYEAPANKTEATLASLWSEILQVEKPGRHDDFFRLGGDSILSIRMVSRAAKQGLQFSPRDVFEKSTIARLAEFLHSNNTGTPARKQPSPTSEIEIPFTPILRWFAEQNFPNPNHYNMVFPLRPAHRLEWKLCEQALNILIHRHDALRLRMTSPGTRARQLHVLPPSPRLQIKLLRESFPASGREHFLNRVAADLQAQIGIEGGRLLSAAYVQGKTFAEDRLIIAVHHIGVDGVSWRILLEEFEEVYENLKNAKPVATPGNVLSFAHWAAREFPPPSSAVEDYWLNAGHARALPADFPDGIDSYASEKVLSRKLDAIATKKLVKEIPAKTHYRPQEILVSALMRILHDWTGHREFVVHLEGHGRIGNGGLDPSRTVGWFTALYPMVFRDGFFPLFDPRQVRKTMRSTPDHGVSYGSLRYHGETTPQLWEKTTEPDIVFNYLGDFSSEGLLQFAPERLKELRDPGARRTHTLEINCFIQAGELHVNWHYGENRHKAETAAGLADEFIKAAYELTENITAEAEGETFALSPAQAGMLTESMFSERGDLHVEQIQAVLRGPVKVSILEEAWGLVLQEHPALRSGFTWDGGDEPRQFTAETTQLKIEVLDAPEDTTRALQAMRNSGFDFKGPPLMRTALFRISEEEHLLVWTFHHILMDGWCLFPVLRRAFKIYEALNEGRTAESEYAPSYQDYIAWLGRRDEGHAAMFFRGKLKGFSGPALPGRVTTEQTAPMDEGHGRRDLILPTEMSAGMKEFAATHGLTMNSVLQGAWAIVLARYNRSSDIVFGATVSGRPPEIPGVDRTIGLFINTLPVRVEVDPVKSVIEVMQAVQDYNLNLRDFEYSSSADVRRWSGLPAGSSLFETILVYENYPFENESFSAGNLHFDMSTLESVGATTAYPLTLLAMPGRKLALRAIHDTRRISGAAAERILEHLALVLNRLRPAAAVAHCMELIPENEIPEVHVQQSAPYAEPRGETERKLADLFRDILGVKRVGRHDDFFALGGQSMRALRLASSIRTVFGRELRLSSLLGGGSVAELAVLLEGNSVTDAKDAVLVPIRPRGTRRPLFLVHPAGASPLCYGVIANRLGHEQPVFGLQPRGLEDDEPFLTTIEDMAAHYILRIREQQPEGPYRLGGWSLGGIIAYEMALQLNDAGQAVEFLGMIDVTVEDHGDSPALLVLKSAAFAFKSILEQDLPRNRREWKHLLSFVGVEIPDDPLQLLTDARLPDPSEWRRTLESLVRVLARFYPIYAINMIAPMLYKPRTFSGQADLFRVEPYFWERPDPVETKLRRYAQGGIRMHSIGGNHMTLMSLKHAPGLAEKMKTRLDELS